MDVKWMILHFPTPRPHPFFIRSPKGKRKLDVPEWMLISGPLGNMDVKWMWLSYLPGNWMPNWMWLSHLPRTK